MSEPLGGSTAFRAGDSAFLLEGFQPGESCVFGGKNTLSQLFFDINQFVQKVSGVFESRP